MQFLEPPLVELVVELKWVSQKLGQAPPGIPAGLPYPLSPNPEYDKFMSTFVELAAESGWSRSERLIPAGFPYMCFQPAMRIQRVEKDGSKKLFQVGPGVFSAHALPPYKNWEAFWPDVKLGIEILLKARSESDGNLPFISANVMYLNVFGENLVGNLSARQFLEEILGIGLSLPSVIKQQAINESEIEPQIALKIPLRLGAEMGLNIAGKVVWGDKKGIMMNITVSNPKGVLPDIDAISQVLDEAHLAIRTTFVGLTEKLHSKMVPVGDAL